TPEIIRNRRGARLSERGASTAAPPQGPKPPQKAPKEKTTRRRTGYEAHHWNSRAGDRGLSGDFEPRVRGGRGRWCQGCRPRRWGRRRQHAVQGEDGLRLRG